MLSAFAGYHVIKFVLWRMGYFARFFHRTRFLTIPLLVYGIMWNVKKTIRDMDEAGVLEYNRRRIRLDKDSYVVEKVLKNRLDLIKERKA